MNKLTNINKAYKYQYHNLYFLKKFVVKSIYILILQINLFSLFVFNLDNKHSYINHNIFSKRMLINNCKINCLNGICYNNICYCSLGYFGDACKMELSEDYYKKIYPKFKLDDKDSLFSIDKFKKVFNNKKSLIIIVILITIVVYIAHILTIKIIYFINKNPGLLKITSRNLCFCCLYIRNYFNNNRSNSDDNLNFLEESISILDSSNNEDIKILRSNYDKL